MICANLFAFFLCFLTFETFVLPLCSSRQIEAEHNMNTYLDQFLLEVVKDYLKSLSQAEFLALTCDLSQIHDGLIRQVYNQACIRNFRAPIRVTADVFGCSKRNITKYLNPKIRNSAKEEL